MLELIALVILIIGLLVFFVIRSSGANSQLVFEKELAVESLKKRKNIAEKRYMQGKIKKEVFDSILEDIEAAILSIEFEIFEMKKQYLIEVEDKVKMLGLKLKHPTKHRKSKLERILRETELLRKETALLETKLLKHEISENVFKRTIKEKESKMIERESKIVEIVNE